MCGICGALNFTSGHFENTTDYITRMRDTMVHRGPDGAGIWVAPDRRVGLGHRRLSIIDLSTAASQPMANEDRSLQVVFNGEIYNHAEIRKELQAAGSHQWKTDHSDTEVIVHAFEQWGIDCIKRFRGMFALAVWDSRKRELWLARDRVGIKPLYYSIHHNRLVFASEIKALLEDPGQKREVNERAFFDFLSFLIAPAPETLFAGIKKLPAGTWLRVSESGQITEHRYWDVFQNYQDLTNVSEEEIAAQLILELREAVQYRKVSDVPVGIFLSGGIDSSTNAALFAEGEGSAVNTFTIGYSGQYASYKNEMDHAKLVAQTIGAQYHERLLTEEDLIRFLPSMILSQDEPIADPVCVPVYYVSKLARDNGTIVCQVGEGADELFWGYRRWKFMLAMEKANHLPLPNFAKKAALKMMGLVCPNTVPYEILRRGVNHLPVFWGGAEAFTENEKSLLLSDRLRKNFRSQTSWDAIAPIYERYKKNCPSPSHLNWMSYLDLNFRLPELLLMRVDKMSMAVSLEARVPFLDHKFVEFAMSIPEFVKTRNGEMKSILKKAVTGVIPQSIINRKKQGFGVPVYEWLFGRLGDQIRAELAAFCKKDLLQWNYVERLLNKKDERVWYLYNFALWHKTYIEKS